MGMMRRVEILIGVIALVLLATIILYVAVNAFMEKEVAPMEQFTIGDRPDAEKLNWDMPDPNNQEAVKLFAEQLYLKANELYKNTENVAMMVRSSTAMMGGKVNVPGYRYIVKNGDQYNYIEYSFILSTGDPTEDLLSGIAGAVEPKNTKFALRKYKDASLDKVLVERVVDPVPEFKFSEETGGNEYKVDWTNVMQEEEEHKIIYYAAQPELYEQTEQKISAETIISAEVTYYEQEGYYKLVLELDPNLATDITRARLIASTGNSSAAYTRLTQTIEIWDNGYFRYFRAQDDWGTSTGFIKLSSEIDFNTYFYYDEYWTNTENYQYMATLKDDMMK